MAEGLSDEVAEDIILEYIGHIVIGAGVPTGGGVIDTNVFGVEYKARAGRQIILLYVNFSGVNDD